MRKPKKRVAKKTAATTKRVKPDTQKKKTIDLHPFKLIAAYRGHTRGIVPEIFDHDFMFFGDTYAAQNGWRVTLGRERFPLSITPEMIAKAVPGQPKKCVIGQAFKALFGNMYDFEVGAGVTKIWDAANKIELRMRPSGKIAKAIPDFDRPPYVWPLKPGLYFMYPISTTRADDYKARGQGKKRRAGEKRDEANNRVVTPIRRQPKKKRASATRSVIRNSRIWLGR